MLCVPRVHTLRVPSASFFGKKAKPDGPEREDFTKPQQTSQPPQEEKEPQVNQQPKEEPKQKANEAPKEQQKPANAEKPKNNEQVKEKPQPTEEGIKEFFTKEELSAERLSKDALTRLIRSVQKSPESSAKAAKEINYLFQDQETMNKLRRDCDTLDKMNQTNREKLLKMQAMLGESQKESDEVATRLRKEIEKEKVFAISKFARDSLDILDNLERSVLTFERSLKQNTEGKESDREKALSEGVKMTLQNALNIYKRFGIVPMDANVGDVSNPNLHESVFHTPVPGKKDGEIIEVSQKGYMIGERVLRPARVGVVKNN